VMMDNLVAAYVNFCVEFGRNQACNGPKLSK
jgi:hypothetical protein